MLKKMFADRVNFIPKTGFNVVGVDSFGVPGEQLYLVGHFDDEKAARAALAKFQKTNPDDAAHVYGPEIDL